MLPVAELAPTIEQRFNSGLRFRVVTAIVLVGAGLFHVPLYELSRLSFQSSLHSHTLLIPMVSFYLLWLRRKTVFSHVRFAPGWGGLMLAVGLSIALYQWSGTDWLQSDSRLFLAVCAMSIWVIGGFVLVFGRSAFRKALFPLLFLGFMLPLPETVQDPVLHFLQAGSALTAHVLLELLGIPVYSEGMLISVPGLTVEVAEQCSGIRSALALVILSTVAGYLFLKSTGRRLILVLAVIPVTILKNGLRIVTLVLLGAYVDIGYLTDSVLHSWGGKPFLLLAVIMMAPILWLLKRPERIRASGSNFRS